MIVARFNLEVARCLGCDAIGKRGVEIARDVVGRKGPAFIGIGICLDCFKTMSDLIPIEEIEENET